MEACIALLPRKSFNTYGAVVLTLFALFGVLVIGISGSFAFQASIHCHYDKTKDSSFIKYINTMCLLKYREKYDITLPVYVMIILNFGIVLLLSIIYAYLVKHRVEEYDCRIQMATTNNEDDENPVMLSSLSSGHNPRDVRKCLGHFSTFSIYIIHLIVGRIIPLFLFALRVFYPVRIPNRFSCTWPLNNTINSQYNLTTTECVIPNSANSKLLVDLVATVNVSIVTLAFLELSYIAWLAYNDRDFMSDEGFCTVYLLRKRKRTRQKLVNRVRKGFNPVNLQEFQLEDKFRGVDIYKRALDDIYVNVVIQEGREHRNAYPRTFDRHAIYQYHFKIPSTVTELTSTADIFKPRKNDENQTCPRTILVIGRPGIGKTILTRRLLFQWAVKAEEFWHEKIVILLQFRKFNKKTTLREMLRHGEGLSSDNFETLYECTLLNPTKTILIFDGLHELDVDSNLLYTNTEAVSSPNEVMQVLSIFKMLVNGRLLPGVTVLTTSRPGAKHLFQNLNFERTLEILGFFEEQIREYVFKFCQDNNDTAELIWHHIKESPELLSLCYIPVNSYIVCLTLKESTEHDESMNIPKTITELYKRAVKVLIYRHHPIYKLKPLPTDYLIIPFAKELEKDLLKLKKVAQSGITKGKLIFERATEDEFGDLANCGLFHKLPDKERNYFCFVHLTLQEFLAASKVVDDIDKVGQFLATHIKDPKWRLVIQFVAGLVGDKIKEAEMTDMGVTSGPKESIMSQENLVDILKRLEEWAFLLGTGKQNEIALLGIKCLYELQDIHIVRPISSRMLAERQGVLLLKHLTITPSDSAALFEFLGNSTTLKRLIFKNCTMLGSNYSYRQVEKLFNTAGNTITSFSCIGSLPDEGVKYLSKAMEGENCKLIQLDLVRNNITDEGVKYLSYGLESDNCKLTELNLGGNKITDQGVEYISDVLKSDNCKLTELNLSGNKITDRGAERLSEALRSRNCKLTELNLGEMK